LLHKVPNILELVFQNVDMNSFTIKVSLDVILGITFEIQLSVYKAEVEAYRVASKSSKGGLPRKGMPVNPRKGNVEGVYVELFDQPLLHGVRIL